MVDNVSLMRKAKAQLSGNWINAVIATLIYMAIICAASFTYVAQLVLAGPLTFGYFLFMACLADTRVNNLNLLFKGFDRFGETLVAGLLLLLGTSVGFALLIVPGVIVALGFSMTFFIMTDDANISGIDALKLSWQIMDGHKWELFCLLFRFIGWATLCILTFGLGTLWLQPYMTLTMLNFYRSLRYGTY